MKHKLLISIAMTGVLSACEKVPEIGPEQQVAEIASEFVEAYYQQYPEEAAESGYPGAPLDRFGDFSEEGTAAFDARVDQWLGALNAIDRDALSGTPAALTWVFTHERLQSLVDTRVCQMSFWNISPTWTGWQSKLIMALGVQPVETAADKRAALARAADISRYVDTEISNLRRGIDAGYAAPGSNVIAVVEQMDSLLATPVEESPFYAPAARSDDAEFKAAFADILRTDVVPAVQRYRDYIAGDYEGREQIGVAANPEGKSCYAASVRFWSSLSTDAEAIHRAGLSEMARIRAEMLAIAIQHFGTDDLQALFEELRSNPEYTFASEQAMLDYVNSAVTRAQGAMSDWFRELPPSRLVVHASPPFEKDSGGGFYSSGASEDELVGYYKVGTYNPTGISLAGTESTAFHESWPGHHLQAIVTLHNKSLHEIQRYMWVSGSGEGWALYAERLADEIGLYSSQLARLGMLSNEAYRAARLVVDPGMHVLGWTREQAIEYMLANTAEGLDSVSGEVDRYAAVPGQATSYLVGSLEIQRLRARAETMLGDHFDIRDFHDRILRNGAVTLPMLGTAIDEWIEETLTD